MPDPSIRATTRADNVDLFINIPRQSVPGLYRRNCAGTVERPGIVPNNPMLWRRKSRYQPAAMVLHLIKLAVGVDDLAHMKKVQAARQEAAPPGPAHAALGLYPQHAAPRRGAAAGRLALLGGARRHPLPPGAGRLRGGFRQGRGAQILPHQGQAHRSSPPRRAPAAPSRAGATTRPTTPRPTCRKGDTGDMPKEMADELKRLGLL